MIDNKSLVDFTVDILDECDIDPKYAIKISEFIHYIMQANKQLNLMSRKLTANDILVDHIKDCLVGVKYFVTYNSIADLGTGGGFPGILLAIVFPDKHFDLYDKSVKKCDYLQKAKCDLKLPNIDVHNNLVHTSKISNDVITCRAFKPINEIIDMTKDYFNAGNQYILYKGRVDNIMEDIALVTRKYKIDYSIEQLGNRSDKQRNMVLLHKII